MPTLNESVRYEADDRPPPLLTAGLGLQYAILSLATVVLAPVVLITVAGESETYLSWAVFAACAPVVKTKATAKISTRSIAGCLCRFPGQSSR